MGLFRKKCRYCREKIEKGQEKFKEVKVLGYVGVFNKPFCSEGHVENYNTELKEAAKMKKGGCFG
ncbi:hypothetical protein ISS07_03690 [Candidatus Woesearchaeota archaeon]|nr:hypothetical protein [Candidatus Woesearchaeota archaeon]